MNTLLRKLEISKNYFFGHFFKIFISKPFLITLNNEKTIKIVYFENIILLLF